MPSSTAFWTECAKWCPTLLERIERLALSSYATDIVIGGLALLAVIASVLLTPSPDAVSLFGLTMPGVCAFKNFTGMDCFGCGLTRSFAYMGELSFREAFQMNFIGPVLYLLVLSQVPYRGYRCVSQVRKASVVLD